MTMESKSAFAGLGLENPFVEDRINNLGGFRPDWDVDRVFDDPTTKVGQAIQQAQLVGLEPDPKSKIHIFAAEAGLGKTHLLGRLQYRHQQEAEFVFIGHYQDELDAQGEPDLERVLRRRVVEHFFHQQNDQWQPVSNMLAELAGPSFSMVLNEANHRVRQRHAGLSDQLNENPASCLSIVSTCDKIVPFKRFADSFAERHIGQTSSAVLRAMAHGWSPGANTARSWLLGDGIYDEEQYASLGLPSKSPSAFDVLRGESRLAHQNPSFYALTKLMRW